MSDAELTLALDGVGVDAALCDAVLDDAAAALWEYDLTPEEQHLVAEVAATIWGPDADAPD